MKSLLKSHWLLFPLILLSINGCSNNKTNTDAVHDLSSTQGVDQQEKEAIHDKYEGSWVDIAPESTEDSNLVYTITKIHDYEYQIGSLKGEIKQLQDGTEYVSVWVQEYGTEMQFTYDNYTKHLILKTALFTKELRKK